MRTFSYRHMPDDYTDEWAIEFKPEHGPEGFIGGAVSEAWAKLIVSALNEKERRQETSTLILDGIQTDGAHHKQWFLEQLATAHGLPVPEDRQIGIAP